MPRLEVQEVQESRELADLCDAVSSDLLYRYITAGRDGFVKDWDRGYISSREIEKKLGQIQNKSISGVASQPYTSQSH